MVLLTFALPSLVAGPVRFSTSILAVEEPSSSLALYPQSLVSGWLAPPRKSSVPVPRLGISLTSASLGNFLAARFMLGFAVGAKSSTTPVYSAESTPKNIRGALTMMWQVRIPSIVLKVHSLINLPDVDCFRYRPWLYRMRCFPKCHHNRRPELSMALDDGFNLCPSADCHASSVLLPRISPLVHGTRPI